MGSGGKHKAQPGLKRTVELGIPALRLHPELGDVEATNCPKPPNWHRAQRPQGRRPSSNCSPAPGLGLALLQNLSSAEQNVATCGQAQMLP